MMNENIVCNVSAIFLLHISDLMLMGHALVGELCAGWACNIPPTDFLLIHERLLGGMIGGRLGLLN